MASKTPVKPAGVSPALKMGAAAVAGAVALLVAVSLGLRWPDSWVEKVPADAADLNAGADDVGLKPLSDRYVEARSGPEAPGRVEETRGRSVAGTPVPASPVAAEARRTDYAAATACSLDMSTMAPGQTRTCRFTATKPGGWNFERDGSDPRSVGGFDWPSARVTVSRDGESTVYEPEFEERSGVMVLDGCADDIIEPGDLVDVELTSGSMDVDFATKVGAGHLWDCSSAGE